ncbi:MAG TPA: polysaccharide biosynthesis tyrosine autokinase [Rhizomicrobium sp.]|jgi:uncharacterized protein involved in exopolysaccharide biosynthesis
MAIAGSIEAGEETGSARRFRPSAADIFRILYGRRGFIFAVAVIVVALTAVVLMLLPTLYSASSVVMLDSRKNNVADASSVLTELPTDPASVQNQIQILTSRDLTSQVVDKLGLDRDPEFNGSGGLFGGSDSAVPGDTSVEQHETTINNFLQHLWVESEGLSTAISIHVTSHSPEKAAQIANTVAETYVEAQLQTKFRATREATGWLESRVRELSRQVEAADAAVERYKVQHNLNDTAGVPLVDQQISATSAQLVAARADLAEKEATYERVNSLTKSGQAADISQAVASPLIVQLRTQEAEVIRNEADLATRYGPKHPKLIAAEQQKKDIEAKIDEEVSRLAGSLANDVSVARAQVASLESSLKQTEHQAGGENIDRVKLKTLEVNSASSHAIYDSFVQRLRSIQDQDAIQSSDASVISHAAVPNVPSSPRRSMIFAASIPAGLMLGVLLALVLERYGPALHSMMPRDPLRGVPVLAELTGIAHPLAADLVTDWPNSEYARSIGQLAQQVAYGAASGGPRVVVVTSPQAGEGAGTIALSLARAAANFGRRVVIVDANVAQPSVAPLAGYRGLRFGLTEVLGGKAQLSRALIKDPRTNALLLSPAQARSDTGRVLGSREMAQLIGYLRGACDLLILNAPPVLGSDGAPALVRYADAVMLVTRAGRPQPEASYAIDSLARISSPPIGVVLAS